MPLIILENKTKQNKTKQILYHAPNITNTNNPILITLFSIQSFSQCKILGLDAQEFEAQPWYGNNQYLTDFLTQRGYYSSNFRTGCNTARYQIPVRIVVFRNASNQAASAISRVLAEQYLADANTKFANAGTSVSFYLEEFEFIAEDEAHRHVDDLFDWEDDDNVLSTLELFIQNRKPGMVSIYFVRNSNTTDVGMASTPISSVIPAEYMAARWSCWVRTHDNDTDIKFDDSEIGYTLTHELGHVLGNAHTHHPGNLYSLAQNGFDGDNAEVDPCHQEVVSRTQLVSQSSNFCAFNRTKVKAEVNGDALSDTPADPNTSWERENGVDLKRVDASTCVYTESGWGQEYFEDSNGTEWDPPTRNYMSYSVNACLSEFSNMQIGLM